jgi:hypothetical protein
MRYLEFKLLENTAQYRQMLAGLVNQNFSGQPVVDAVINSTRKLLKRSDRITWYLKWYRLAFAYKKTQAYIAGRTDPKYAEDVERIKKIFSVITKAQFDSVDVNEIKFFSNNMMPNSFIMDHLEYQLSLPNVDVITWDTNWTPRVLKATVDEAEKEYNRKQSQYVTHKAEDKIILNYGKQAWVMLDRGACDAEGDAMGHCGNVPSVREGDRIISFRTIDGESHKPHLTFILNADGYLGEMKGRANQKPNSKYHPYIVDLLKQDFVKGIRGGGYAPDQNFEIWDLDQALMQKLLKAKPTILPEIEKYVQEKRVIPPEIQADLLKRDPRWLFYIKNPTPDVRVLRKQKAYAIVSEPGLTALSWKQYLTKEEYLTAVKEYGDDAFSVKFLQK